MLDLNMIIANNIQAELKKENKKQVDLAEGIGVSKQTMSKIMNGARAINAIELHKISEYLHVSMDSLMKMPEKPMDTNVIHAFMGRVKTEEARKGIRLADERSDMILFHTRVCENFNRRCRCCFLRIVQCIFKNRNEKNYPALTITFYSMGATAVVLLPFTQWGHIGHYITVNPVRNTLFMLMHSLCTAVCPYVFYTVALDHMEAGKASILCSCEPVAAMVFGFFFFKEIPTVLSITGFIIVLVALAMLVLSDKKQEVVEE